MKWTKFKEKTPTDPYVLITDWYCVWPLYQQFADWVQYAINNPEYAWVDIPRPDVPEQDKKMHKCEVLGMVWEPAKEFWLQNPVHPTDYQEYAVNFCPFCGLSIKDSVKT